MKSIILTCLLLFTSLCFNNPQIREELLTEKFHSNPIPRGATALVFTPTDPDLPSRTITDQDVITALRESYRWTNDHLFCCLEGKTEAYMTVYVHGMPQVCEPHRMKDDLSVPSYNLEFRTLLYQAYQQAGLQ